MHAHWQVDALGRIATGAGEAAGVIVDTADQVCARAVCAHACVCMCVRMYAQAFAIMHRCMRARVRTGTGMCMHFYRMVLVCCKSVCHACADARTDDGCSMGGCHGHAARRRHTGEEFQKTSPSIFFNPTAGRLCIPALLISLPPPLPPLSPAPPPHGIVLAEGCTALWGDFVVAGSALRTLR